MALLEFANFGAIIFMAAVLFFVIKEFLKFMKIQEGNFNDLVKNHLDSDTKAKNRMDRSFDKLAHTIDELLKWLKNSNGKNK